MLKKIAVSFIAQLRSGVRSIFHRCFLRYAPLIIRRDVCGNPPPVFILVSLPFSRRIINGRHLMRTRKISFRRDNRDMNRPPIVNLRSCIEPLLRPRFTRERRINFTTRDLH